MKALCYSVKLEALVSISDKCYKALAFDGSEALIPKSQVYGRDWDISKSEAYWISAWILSKTSIQHSSKKPAWVNSDTGKVMPTYARKVHKPIKKDPVIIQPNENLLRP